MSEEPDAYRELGVAPDARQEAIDAAYHAQIKVHHPDLCAGRGEAAAAAALTKTQRLNAAFAEIGTAEKRRDYDARRRGAAPAEAATRRRRGPRVSASRYFRRRGGDGEMRPVGVGTVAVVVVTLALIAFWLVDVAAYWEAAE